MASVIRLCRPDDDRYDPDLLRRGDEEIPAVKVQTKVEQKRKRARKGLFLAATAPYGIQVAVRPPRP